MCTWASASTCPYSSKADTAGRVIRFRLNDALETVVGPCGAGKRRTDRAERDQRDRLPASGGDLTIDRPPRGTLSRDERPRLSKLRPLRGWIPEVDHRAVVPFRLVHPPCGPGGSRGADERPRTIRLPPERCLVRGQRLGGHLVRHQDVAEQLARGDERAGRHRMLLDPVFLVRRLAGQPQRLGAPPLCVRNPGGDSQSLRILCFART
jgi:hypothetical protein